MSDPCVRTKCMWYCDKVANMINLVHTWSVYTSVYFDISHDHFDIRMIVPFPVCMSHISISVTSAMPIVMSLIMPWQWGACKNDMIKLEHKWCIKCMYSVLLCPITRDSLTILSIAQGNTVHWYRILLSLTKQQAKSNLEENQNIYDCQNAPYFPHNILVWGGWMGGEIWVESKIVNSKHKFGAS